MSATFPLSPQLISLSFISFPFIPISCLALHSFSNVFKTLEVIHKNQSVYQSCSSPTGTSHWKATATHQHQPLCHQEDCGSEHAGRGSAHGQLVAAEDCALRGASVPLLHPPHCAAVTVHHSAGRRRAASRLHRQVSTTHVPSHVTDVGIFKLKHPVSLP